MDKEIQAGYDEEELVSLTSDFSFENKGDVLSGTLVGHTYFKGNDGNLVPRFTLYSDEYGFKSFNGSVALTTLQFVPAGTHIRIEYQGEETVRSGMGKVKRYDVKCPRGFARAAMQDYVSKGGIQAVAKAQAQPILIESDDDPFSDEMKS